MIDDLRAWFGNGQARRQALDATINEALHKYLGPTGIPARLDTINELLNPVRGMEDASISAQTMANPELSMWDRAAAGGRMATEVAGAAAPLAAGRLGGSADDAARAIQEALTGMSAAPSAVAGRDFLADEAGAIRAWHGSPHDFDKFSMDKIGTGEGAQAYGHGLYFAENRAVGEGYQQALAPMAQEPFLKIGLSEQEAREAASFAKTTISGEPRLAAESFAAWKGKIVTPEMVQAFDDAMKTKGRLYEVEIDANPEDFLDWDAPLSEQPEKVRAWFDSRGITEGFAGQQSGNELFQAERRAFDDESALAASMRDGGLAGVKYLDHGSRFNAIDGLGPATNTRNYVVFDDNLVSIIKKYGIAGAAGLLGLSAQELQAQINQQQPATLDGLPR